eukprot:758377-Hanusia_phi.AAC.2
MGDRAQFEQLIRSCDLSSHSLLPSHASSSRGLMDPSNEARKISEASFEQLCAQPELAAPLLCSTMQMVKRQHFDCCKLDGFAVRG